MIVGTIFLHMKHLSNCLYDNLHSNENTFYSSIVLIILAGLPPTTTLLGTSFVTTAPDAITALSPIEIPGLIIAPRQPKRCYLSLQVFHILCQSSVPPVTDE